MWEPQLRSFSGGHRVILLDLPGYGLASEENVPETLAGFADRVHVLLAELSKGPSVIVGHSFGGYVALQLLRDHPEDFSGMVLTNTRSGADAPETRAKRLATAGRLERPGEGLDVDETARGLLAPAAWIAGGELRDTVREMIKDARASTVRATLLAIANRPDLTPVLGTIRVPSLVVWGEEDRLIPPVQTRAMVGQIPGATGVEVPGVAHLPSLEAPELFDRALDDFLGRGLGRP